MAVKALKVKLPLMELTFYPPLQFKK